jgi:hypothetical protein
MSNVPKHSTIHIVTIGEDTRRDQPYFITPSEVIIKKYDVVIFRNLTKGELSVVFDPASEFPLDGSSPFAVTANEDLPKIVKVATRGTYPYEVYCGPDSIPAEGTRPIFIGFES